MPSTFTKILRISVINTFLLFTAFFFSGSTLYAAPDGKALFMANCATCHNPLKDATGPALKGVDTRSPGMDWLHDWVHNSSAVIATGDPYAVKLKAKWKTVMTPFPNLSNEDIDAIITYVNSVEEVKIDPNAAKGGGAGNKGGDNDWLYVAITIVLLVLALILARVNMSLRRVTAEKEGQPVLRDVPFYRHKFFIAISVIVLLCLGGYWMVNGAVNMGRQQNYTPKQPIFYSHKVHAGINQINCLYCHAGAEKSRQAMIPSSNVCMNCHKQIDSYSGAETHPLVDLEGNTINGTAQIDTLYKYAGWNKELKDYNRDANGNVLATPISWVKVHNLPDHVYFNHSQHVKVGQVQCQQCHGAIEEMDEVKQFAPLSMGWCINCHRQTQVRFSENNYYSIYTKYQQELKDGKRTGVTVEDIGGIECQKCHY